MDKVRSTAADAVSDIKEGATIAVAGFGIGHRFPSGLILALRDQGTKDLTIVCNSIGGGGSRKAEVLVVNRQVSKLIASFSARAGTRSPAEEQITQGTLSVELVPQGTLVERCRAGGAGVPAFYTPTGVGTTIAEGKELRYFDGKPHILEAAIKVDYAFLRAHRADRMGNLQFRGGSQNFNPSFAKAAKVAIAEVDEIVEVGEIPPDQIHLPGIFVTRVVKNMGAEADLAELRGARKLRRPADSARQYNGKPALTRLQIAERAARLLQPGSVVNLGTGIPTFVGNYIEGKDILLHSENGILGYGPNVSDDDADPDIYNAAGAFVSLVPGASFFDSVESFEMARGGKIETVLLGAYQVAENGDLANWSTPEMVGGGIGGAMDLVSGDPRVIVTMEHRDSRDRPKLVKTCTYPLTRPRSVDTVVTDLALFTRKGDRFVLEEVAPGFDPSEIQALTEMQFDLAPNIKSMTDVA